MRFKPMLLLAFALVFFAGCDALVEDVEDPIDTAEDAALNHVSQLNFLMNGVQARFGTTNDRIGVMGGLLSDQFIFGGSGATFPTYRELDEAQPLLDNNSVDGALANVGQYRFLADDLINRVETIDGLAPEDGGFDEGDEALRERALFTAYFHGGLARYFWATYFGLEARRGGGIISTIDELGDFIESEEMYDLALERLETALNYTADEYEERLVNSIKARIHLFRNNLDQARTFGEAGLQEGDEPFESLHLDRTGTAANFWYNEGGPGRVQVAAAPRFYYDYLEENLEHEESVRIPLALDSVIEDDEGQEVGRIHRQALYDTRGAPIDFMTWQENELMLAELDLRQGQGDGAERVNAVRASHGLDPVDMVDLNVVFTERDKELFTQALRLVDQRRVQEHAIDVDEDLHGWHRGPDTWWYLPITQNERNHNPNID